MTTKVNPPVFAEVVGSWQDAIRAARAMLPLLGVALLVIAAYQASLVVSGSVLNPRLLGRSIALLVEIVQGLVASVLLIPWPLPSIATFCWARRHSVMS